MSGRDGYGELRRPEWTPLHRSLQVRANVVQLILRPVLQGRKDKAHEALRPLTEVQRRVVMAETLDVLEALLLRLPGLRAELDELWGEYLYAGYPDYEHGSPDEAP